MIQQRVVIFRFGRSKLRLPFLRRGRAAWLCAFVADKRCPLCFLPTSAVSSSTLAKSREGNGMQRNRFGMELDILFGFRRGFEI